MTILVDRSRLRPRLVHVGVALIAFVVATSLPAVASAQGRCSCNNGCHQYPGQCVQPGSSGCESGFAPFCATRAGTCPNASWVSCGGECTCVRITPLDAGVPDAGRTDASTTTDVPASMDLGVSRDVPASMDARPPADVLVSMDARPPADAPVATDIPGRDAPAVDVPGSDVIAPTGDAMIPVSDRPGTPTDSPEVLVDGGVPVLDAATTPDSASPSDAPARVDAGCECVGGACIGDVCYRDRCVYNPELGFICASAGTSCRLVNGEPICVPICAGVTCGAGEFCDERSNGLCVADRCATMQCPIGTTCQRNQCGRWGDGGVAMTDGSVAADGSSAPPTATEDGCGCRVGQTGGRRGLSAALSALFALFALSGGRRRRCARVTPGQRSRSTT